MLLNCGSSKDMKQEKKKPQGPVFDTTASGLMYRDVKVGSGHKPTYGQTVTIKFIGKLQDGTVFESSYEKGESVSFVIGEGEAIEGLEEGVMTMRESGKRILKIPPDLAYGSRGVGETIPPNSTVILEVELIDIE